METKKKKGSTNLEYKKQLRKTEEGTEKRLNRHGKQPHQRMKPYLILDFLMRQTDEDGVDYKGEAEHVQSAFDIADYLESNFGINADRRSIYADIEEINKILYMLQNMEDGECLTIEEVDEEFARAEEEGYLSELQTILYDKTRKGFYVR